MLKQLFAKDLDRVGRIDTDSDLITTNVDDGDADVSVDDEGFADAAGENENGCLLGCCLILFSA